MSSDHEFEPRKGPLHRQHVDRGAKMVDFAGWLMPIEYEGVLKEHQYVREAVGVFDVSHMGTVQLLGNGAIALVDAAFALDARAVEPGRAAYGLCLNEDGGVIDDLLIYVKSQTDVIVIPNASNAQLVLEALNRVQDSDDAYSGVEIVDAAPDTAIIAVQGPAAGEVLRSLGLPTDLEYMSFSQVVDCGELSLDGVVARSGYTGEYGFELVVPIVQAAAVWNAVVSGAEARGGGPVALGARDTLRLEMGYPLHGHELAADRIATSAPVGWSVGWDKPSFVGKGALVAAKASPRERKIIGLRFKDRGIPREGMNVVAAGDSERQVGVVTSGTFSPTLKVGIAMALVDADALDEEVDLAVDVRGRECAVERVKLPFVDSSPREVPA